MFKPPELLQSECAMMPALLLFASFVDVASEAALSFTLNNGPTPEKHLIETMPGGIAVFDYDRDGWIFANGAADNDGRIDLFVAGVFRNILYRDRGDCSFEDVTAKAGLRSDHCYVSPRAGNVS
jgi:enediyne biosynthesis protein E4